MTITSPSVSQSMLECTHSKAKKSIAALLQGHTPAEYSVLALPERDVVIKELRDQLSKSQGETKRARLMENITSAKS
jgi:hypothetical protein